MTTHFLSETTAASVTALPEDTSAKVALARLFSDNCVLQASAPIPVYGTAAPGSAVTVHFRAQTATATADISGEWIIHLRQEVASEMPATLTVTGATNTVVVHGVLVGEVWICAGQSNMEWILADSENGGAEVSAANDPLLRMFTVPKRIALAPRADVEGGEWQCASPSTAGNFSAVGYYFAHALRQSRGVPVGMIHASWGGTRIQAWSSKQTLADARKVDGEFVQTALRTDAGSRAAQKRHHELWDRWVVAGSPAGIFDDPGVSESAQGWEAFGVDDSDWQTAMIPGSWEKSGVPDLEAIDGGVWFRKSFFLSHGDAGKPAMLTLGAIDDFDHTFINGVPVGATGKETPGFWLAPRHYPIPDGVLKAGRNVIAVRVWDHTGDGGMIGPADSLCLTVENRSPIPLAGLWRFQVENIRPSIPSPSADTDTVLYNGMLAPLAPYGIRGFLWYQGEANTGEPTLYKTILPAMIAQWRADFQNPVAPFLVVQLAPWQAEGPTGTSWALFREAQQEAIATVENGGITILTDVGDVEDIHPRRKKPVGERSARLARRIAYAEKIVLSPTIKDTMRQGDSIKVTFTDVGEGLTVPVGTDNLLTGWEIAGEDGVYHPAMARLSSVQKDEVYICSPAVPLPARIRYGWANVPCGNLFNSEGLPAAPFRADLPPNLPGGR
ncbi:MAG: hypothetical protein H8F28_19535 [Fibrella sp.]|nr:hypothetical protein [Armatimonadota bacterium]